jgi:hypothetical protein
MYRRLSCHPRKDHGALKEIAHPHLLYTSVQDMLLSTVDLFNPPVDASGEGIAFWCRPHDF